MHELIDEMRVHDETVHRPGWTLEDPRVPSSFGLSGRVQTEKQHRADSHNIAPKMAEEPREKRERKATVEVYSIASPTKKEFVIPEGAGTKVGDIPNGA